MEVEPSSRQLACPLERLTIRVAVGEEDFERWAVAVELAEELQPGSATPGAEVDDPLRTGACERPPQPWGDECIVVPDVQRELRKSVAASRIAGGHQG